MTAEHQTRTADSKDMADTDDVIPADLVPADLRERAAGTLLHNWAKGHTVPSRSLYPHQWSWDAGFIAIGLAYCDPARGWQDLRSLFAGQWADGRVPHIVFDPDVAEADYFPGPAFWRAPTPPGLPGGATTAIVQPPVHALAALRLYQVAADNNTGVEEALAQLRWFYPRLVAQQDYLLNRRDAGGAGLPSIVHPWESGLDNSPAWDAALNDVPIDEQLLVRHTRQDLRKAHADHRPTNRDYARYIHIVDTYRAAGYADDGLVDRHPFVVECPNFASLTGAAELALAEIAQVIGADPVPHRARAQAITEAVVERLYDPVNSSFHALDVRTGKLSPAHCVSGLLPLILPALPTPQVEAIMANATSPRFGLPGPSAGNRYPLPVPSYDRTAWDFDPYRYWRGPTWINVNWLIWRGLLTHGYAADAAALRESMLKLVAEYGFHEYYDPATGAGIGAATFSWSAALTLDLLAVR